MQGNRVLVDISSDLLHVLQRSWQTPSCQLRSLGRPRQQSICSCSCHFAMRGSTHHRRQTCCCQSWRAFTHLRALLWPA